VFTNDRISVESPRRVVAAKAIPPMAIAIPAKLKSRPIVACDSPGRAESTARNSSIDIISSIDIEPSALICDMSELLVAVVLTSIVVAGTVADVAPAGDGAETVNENTPSIGWASGARTLHFTPISPPASGGSKVSVKTLLSRLDTAMGARTWPLASRMTNPSPASSDSPVKTNVTRVIGSVTTSPFDGVEPAKSVCALTD
jgi:hypothetical protein